MMGSSLCFIPSQDKEEQWMTKLVPGSNDFAMLQPLQWNTRYEVEITARNVKGLSEPTFYQFFMPQKPDITGNGFIVLLIGCNASSFGLWAPAAMDSSLQESREKSCCVGSVAAVDHKSPDVIRGSCRLEAEHIRLVRFITRRAAVHAGD